MINIGPFVNNAQTGKASGVKKSSRTTTRETGISRHLPEHSNYLTNDRRSLVDRRRAKDQKAPLLELRSGRDRRRGTTAGRLDLSV